MSATCVGGVRLEGAGMSSHPPRRAQARSGPSVEGPPLAGVAGLASLGIERGSRQTTCVEQGPGSSWESLLRAGFRKRTWCKRPG